MPATRKRGHEEEAGGATAQAAAGSTSPGRGKRSSSSALAKRAGGTSPGRSGKRARRAVVPAAAAPAPAPIAAVQMEPTMTLAEVITKGRRRGKPMKSMGSCVGLHRFRLPLALCPLHAIM